jgi:uracil-DNA glycosylase
MGPMDPFEAIRQALVDDESNAGMTQLGWQPLFTGSAASKIVVVGQAPGRLAQASGVPWNDASGRRLVDWLGVSEQQFRDPDLFAMMPMDFYFPGTGRSGDLPPRRGFAARWHPPLLALMPEVRLTLLIGRYAQLHYLPARGTLTDTVRDFRRVGSRGAAATRRHVEGGRRVLPASSDLGLSRASPLARAPV